MSCRFCFLSADMDVASLLCWGLAERLAFQARNEQWLAHPVRSDAGASLTRGQTHEAPPVGAAPRRIVITDCATVSPAVP